MIRFELAPVLQIIHHTRKFLGVHIHNILSHVKPTKHEASEELRVGFALFSCRARVSNAEYKPEPAVGTKKKKLKKKGMLQPRACPLNHCYWTAPRTLLVPAARL